METKIIVIYLGIAGIRSEDIGDYTKAVTSKIIPSTFQGEIIIIPTQSVETKIECINPKYITNKELIKQHTESMKRLQDELKIQEELLKKQKENE